MNPILRTDAAIARLSSLVAQAAGMKRKDGRPLRPEDFLPYADAVEEELNIDDVARSLGVKF